MFGDLNTEEEEKEKMAAEEGGRCSITETVRGSAPSRPKNCAPEDEVAHLEFQRELTKV